MTAAQVAREFTYLRTLQRLLRLYEESHGNVHGVAHLRLQVIDEMKKAAKLMKYGLS